MLKNNNKTTGSILIDFFLLGCLLILIVGGLAVIAFQVEAILFRYPLDYGEAPLINQAMQFNAGKSIYRSNLNQPPFTIANYPPVYVLLLALFESFFGPAFWYGRMISTLSVLGSTVLITLVIYKLSNNWKLSLLPGLLFLNIPYVAGWSTLARIDHLALFFALSGIFLILFAGERDRLLEIYLFLGCGALLLAIFTRQSYALAAPLGCFLFLSCKNWKKGLVFFGLIAGSSMMLSLLLNITTRGGFYFNIVTANINPFGWERLIDNFRNFFRIVPTIFILSVLGLIVIPIRLESWSLWVGFIFGGFLSALTIGKIGSNVNYFLELAAGLSLIIGLGLLIIAQHQKPILAEGVVGVVLLLLSVQGVLMIQTVRAESRWMLDNRIENHDELKSMEELVHQHAGQPMLADEYMGMIVLAGDEIYLQPFEITQLINAGLFDQSTLIEEIENEKFPLILLQEGSWWSYVVEERWTPELLETIRNEYRLTAQFDQTNIYQPRTPRTIVVPDSCPGGVMPIPTNASLGFRYQEGKLTIFGGGVEGQVPVNTPMDGQLYRPESYPPGALVIVFPDPYEPSSNLMMLFEDMRSFRGEPILIDDRFVEGTAGLPVAAGETIGFQSNWSGRINQQDWLHVTIGIAPYSPLFLDEYDLLIDNLINPEDYFGLEIDIGISSIRPVKCIP